MDRQRRYQSLLSTEDCTVLAALDCLTLSRLAKSRPVDVIIFDLQHPAMSANDWLGTIDRDPELTCLPTVWVGRDVPRGIYDRIKALSNSIAITARPDAPTLLRAIKRVMDSSKNSLKKLGDTGPISNNQWQPGEGIIDQALSIFDSPSDETATPPESAPPSPKGPEWSALEVDGAANGQKKSRSNSKAERDPTEAAQLEEKPPEDDSILQVNAEEVTTGKFKIAAISKRDTDSGYRVVPEKMMPHDTAPKIAAPTDQSQKLIERITTEVLDQLTDKLARELISRINPEMVRHMVEKKFGDLSSDQLPTP